MKLLHIDSSILGEHSASRTLTGRIVEQLLAQRPQLQVAYRDLAQEELPHLSGQALRGDEPAAASRDAEVLREFLAADVIVIGTPVYNFTVPSQLKAWIDRIAVAGKTFRYTANGPEGLAGGKEVIIAVARGGVRVPGSSEFAESYLRHMMSFLGVRDVRVVRAEGLALPGANRTQVLQRALEDATEPLPRAA